MTDYKRMPRHIGIIPDGNRRWAVAVGGEPEEGYAAGVEKGKDLFNVLYYLDIDEVTVYGFTADNTKRKSHITTAYIDALLSFVEWVKTRDVSVLVVGDRTGHMFPKELKEFVDPAPDRSAKQKINILANYSWESDLHRGAHSYLRWYEGYVTSKPPKRFDPYTHLQSRHISRIDLVIRWGGMRRLSGFLPVQTVYSDFYVVDDMWPDFKPAHIQEALDWYQTVDVTLGG